MIEYTHLVPIVPAICFIVVGLFGKKTPEGGGYIAILGAMISCALSIAITYEYMTTYLYINGQAFTKQWEWLVVAGHHFDFGVYVDTMTCATLLFSSFISMLILIYSIGYMRGEGNKKRRYYAEMSLFLTGMFGLVVSSDFLEMFIFWEIMGLCSYLLIGFWGFDNPDARQKASAAKKAFLVTRLGDVCLMLALFILLYIFHTLNYELIYGDRFFIDSYYHLGALSMRHGAVGIALLLFFAGAIGKSAQFPLHDWLPDAMAGPTTVSALIHAATMVKAGVYLVARTMPFLVVCHYGDDCLVIIGMIGAFTSLFAATMALNNMNIKRVLAYSTISQLGYMFLGLSTGGILMWQGHLGVHFEIFSVGTLAYFAAIFHMFNHAFFKALLFLGSGSVIHSCGTEDMRLMGGLGRRMRSTSLTMLIGTLSIVGFPFFSGFWSKDLILEATLATGELFPIYALLYDVGMIAAFMTSFYMLRMWYMTFSGKPKECAQHCHGESPVVMTLPLHILAIFALLSGFVIIAGFDLAGGLWLGSYDMLMLIIFSRWTHVSVIVAVFGMFVAFLMYRLHWIKPGWFNGHGKGIIYRILADRYHIPQLYNQISWRFGYDIARVVDCFDRNIVDGIVNGLSNVVIGNADEVKKAETGYVRDYTMLVATGVVALVLTLVAITYVMGVI